MQTRTIPNTKHIPSAAAQDSEEVRLIAIEKQLYSSEI